MNEILEYIPIGDVTDVRNLVQAAAILVGEILDVKERKQKVDKEPYWTWKMGGNLRNMSWIHGIG